MMVSCWSKNSRCAIFHLYAYCVALSLFFFYAAQASDYLIPPIKRLGILQVSTNIVEFRKFKNEALHREEGFTALPLSDQQVEQALTEMSEKAAVETGRFLVLTLGSQLMDQREQLLAKSYDLDSFLFSRVWFEPDQTKITLTLKFVVSNAGKKQLVSLVKEELYLPANANEEQIFDGVRVLLGRIVQTLGHDGKVTGFSGNLVTLDFGTERGVSVGKRVLLGFQKALAVHPVTGEVFKVVPAALFEVEILEAEASSSLGRIVARDQQALLGIGGHEPGAPMDLETLLAWRKPDVYKNESQQTNWGNQAFPAADLREQTASRGFTGGSHNLTAKMPPALDKGLAQPPVTPPQADGTLLTKQGQNKYQLNKDSSAVPKSVERSSDERSAEGYPNDEKVDAPSGDATSWNLSAVSVSSVKLGVGANFAQLNTDLGARFSGLSSSLLNQLSLQAAIELPQQLLAKPQLTYAWFSGGDVEGGRVELAIPILMPLPDVGDADLKLGGELGFSSGQVKTVRVKSDLGHVDLQAIGDMGYRFAGLGKAVFGVGLSPFALFDGNVNGFVAAELFPSQLAPEELSIFLKLAKSKSHFVTYEVGGAWSFGMGEGK